MSNPATATVPTTMRQASAVVNSDQAAWRGRVSWRSRAMRMAHLGISVAVACVLLSSAVSHLANPYYFLSSIYKYEIVGPLQGQLLAAVLPILQLAIAVCLLGRLLIPGALLISFLLFAVFTAAQISGLVRGLSISCGCFSSSASHLISYRTILFVASLAVASVIAYTAFILDQRQSYEARD